VVPGIVEDRGGEFDGGFGHRMLIVDQVGKGVKEVVASGQWGQPEWCRDEKCRTLTARKTERGERRESKAEDNTV
jgi:hypothetical protein